MVRQRAAARRPRRALWFALLLWFVVALPPKALSTSPGETGVAGWPPGLGPQRSESRTVVAVLDAGRLRLDDGRVLTLAALQVPLELGGAEAGPLHDRLSALLLEQAIAFDPAAARIDRYGRVEAQVTAPGDRWLQSDLVRRGLARVLIDDQPTALLQALLRAEDAARRGEIGLWADPAFRPLPAARAEAGIGRFQLVEGRVLDSAVVRGRSYLNFGADWRSDFTVVIPPRERRRFAAAGRSAEALEGRWIRVRGWLGSFNGPMIEVRHPDQIELLSD